MASNVPCLLVLPSGVPPILYQGCAAWNMASLISVLVPFLFLTLSLNTFSEENQLPFHKQPYRGAQMVKEWDFLAGNYVNEFESGSSSSAKPSDDYSLADILVVTTWDALNQKHSVKLFPDLTMSNGVRY